jgi:hypothetical protein
MSNNIWDEGAIAIAKEWKDKLQPGMAIDLSVNNIWPEGAKTIAENWKDKLQPGMAIDLNYNNIWLELAETIAENWKDKLQPKMTINLRYNKIWDDWAEIIKTIILKDWVTIDLRDNDISQDKKQELKDWEKSYRGKWINCKVLVE